MERVFKVLRIAAPALAVGLAILFGPIALLMLFRPRGLFGREY